MENAHIPDPESQQSVQEVFDSLNSQQKKLLEYLVGEALALGGGELDADLFGDDQGSAFSEHGIPQHLVVDHSHDDQGHDGELFGLTDGSPEAAWLANSRQELVDLINKLAVVRGKVTLSSGKEADYYIDLRRVTLHHRGSDLIGELLLAHLAANGYFIEGFDGGEIAAEDPSAAGRFFAAVGGLTLGADPIATAMMHAANEYGLELNAFVVRKAAKAHGMQRQIEGPDITGKNVVIVEDTTTTGGSPITAIEAVRAAGANPVAVATIVDRNTGAREKIEELGVPYFPLFNLEDLTI